MMRPAGTQRGAASIEFAALFVLLFMLFYALVGYALPLTLASSYQQLAAEGLREAIRHPELLRDEDHATSIAAAQQGRVVQVIEGSGLPAEWRSPCGGYGDGYLRVQGALWSVCLRHANPGAILPRLSLLGWEFPQLPDEIRGEASIRLR